MRRIIKILSIFLLMFVFVTSANAQVFLMDFDQGENPRVESEDYNLFIGGVGWDGDMFYAPLGSGLLLLGGLGGAYLLSKKKKKD